MIPIDPVRPLSDFLPMVFNERGRRPGDDESQAGEYIVTPRYILVGNLGGVKERRHATMWDGIERRKT